MKTYIIVRRHFMADYILDALSGDSEYVICTHIKKRSFAATIKRFIRAILPGCHKGLWTNSLFPENYIESLRKISPDDKVIFWAVENLKDLKILSQEIDTKNLTSLLWDPMTQVCHNSESEKKSYPLEMDRLGIRTCTFDRDDAIKFGFDYVGQVYRSPQNYHPHDINSDIFFVGADKGRTDILNKLAKNLNLENIRFNFNILPKKNIDISKFPALGSSFIPSPMPYTETIRNIHSSKCVVEILQPGQSGMTLRALEALFFHKKLITDNLSIKHEAMYFPENVYIIDDPEQPWENFRSFLDAPLTSPPKEILEKYEIRSWIKEL